MKKLLFLLFFFILSIAGYSQELFSYDFSHSKGATTFNADGLTHSAAMVAMGFGPKISWLYLRESNASDNFFVACSSSFTPAGQANRWLVFTEPIVIPYLGCVLEWKSQAYDPKKRDGLKVFISTTKFTTTNVPKMKDPVWEIEEEEAGSDDPNVIESEWVHHSISLDAYVGQGIYIGFANQSYDKSMILLDDVWVGRRTDFSISLTGDEYVTSAESKVSGVFRVISDVTIDSYTVSCSYGDTEYSKTYSGLGLGNGGTHAFAFDEGIPLEMGKPVEYKVCVEVDGKPSIEQTGKVTRVSHFPKRNVVIEEGTGTWCGNCVTGIWAMDYLNETYGKDGFIGIAVHNRDPMTDETYDRGLGINAFPMGVVNRKVWCSPTNSDKQLQSTGPEPKTFVDHYLKAREEGTIGEIAVEGSYNQDSTQIKAEAVVKSVALVTNVDYRVCFVLVENDVNGYRQVNYASGSSTPMGGFEKLPDPCSVTFNEVARGIWPSFKGELNSLPSTITPGQPVEYSYTITLPIKKIKNVENLELIGLLINGKSGEIMNAGKYEMVTGGSGISQTEGNLLETWVSGGRLSVLLNGTGRIDADLFDMSGFKIGSACGDSNVVFSMPVNGYRGVAVLHVRGEQGVVIRKINF